MLLERANEGRGLWAEEGKEAQKCIWETLIDGTSLVRAMVTEAKETQHKPRQGPRDGAWTVRPLAAKRQKLRRQNSHLLPLLLAPERVNMSKCWQGICGPGSLRFPKCAETEKGRLPRARRGRG